MRTYEAISADFNYDEAKIVPYTLPDPLVLSDGARVKNAAEWLGFQRGEILDLLKKEEYGEIPPRPDSMRFETLTVRNDALGDTAVRKEIRLHFGMNNGKTHHFDMLLYIPKHAECPAPAFLGLNFKGNHATTGEEDVAETGFSSPGELVFQDARGAQSERWSFREVIARGYASATVCYHDIYPDFKDKTSESVFGMLFPEAEHASLPRNYTPIGAWAWGLSRALDCLEAETSVDSSRVAVHGHSRLGKTSLWAGAVDSRFKLVIANCSGCGGAALHKRKIGENVEALISHGCADWFVTAFHRYSGKEELMPFDQHELLALIAPRALCLGTATLDIDSDPMGEFLAAVHASEIYALFGGAGLPAVAMPPSDVNITGSISFHCRTGKHNQTLQDWLHYLDAADTYLRPRKNVLTF